MMSSVKSIWKFVTQILYASIWSVSTVAATDESNKGVLDPWIDFVDRLGAVTKIITSPDTPHDPVTVADGYQWLPRLLRLAWEHAHEYADTEHPVIFKATGSYLTNGWQTTDAVYYSAIIDGTKTYRITGKRGTAPLIEFTTNEGFDGMQRRSVMVASITEKDLQLNEDNSFTLFVSPRPHPGNWLKTTADTNLIYLRQYTHDWGVTKQAEVDIELLEEDKSLEEQRVQLLPTGARYATEAPKIADVWSAYRKTVEYVLNYLEAYHQRAVGLLRTRRNDLQPYPHDEGSTMPAGHRFAVAMFDLAENEILLIEFAPEDAPYWGVQLGNFWGETLAYDGSAPTRLNNRTAQVDADGYVRIAISNAPRPTGVSNWLSTVGRPVGSVIYRQFRQFSTLPSFQSRVITR